MVSSTLQKQGLHDALASARLSRSLDDSWALERSLHLMDVIDARQLFAQHCHKNKRDADRLAAASVLASALEAAGESREAARLLKMNAFGIL